MALVEVRCNFSNMANPLVRAHADERTLLAFADACRRFPISFFLESTPGRHQTVVEERGRRRCLQGLIARDQMVGW